MADQSFSSAPFGSRCLFLITHARKCYLCILSDETLASLRLRALPSRRFLRAIQLTKEMRLEQASGALVTLSGGAVSTGVVMQVRPVSLGPAPAFTCPQWAPFPRASRCLGLTCPAS